MLSALQTRLTERLSSAYHGDYPAWRASLDALPDLACTDIAMGDTVAALGTAISFFIAFFTSQAYDR